MDIDDENILNTSNIVIDHKVLVFEPNYIDRVASLDLNKQVKT